MTITGGPKTQQSIEYRKEDSMEIRNKETVQRKAFFLGVLAAAVAGGVLVLLPAMRGSRMNGSVKQTDNDSIFDNSEDIQGINPESDPSLRYAGALF
jgi:hypothetical protein